MDYFVHDTAIIDDGAKIGANTKIWHWVHVSNGAHIGSNCSLGQNCYVASSVIIGSNVKIQNNVSVYDNVKIEDDVFCGPSMVFTNVINPRSFIERKDEYKNTLLKRGCSIGSNATIYRASKAAVNNIMVSVSEELKSENITVVSFHPGWVRTDMGGANATLSAKDSAKELIKSFEKLSFKDTGKFFNYDGTMIKF
jgi:NAD(P)-dependent dehydrogenase (short-subunit alcohol dehydrogenase family)